MNGSTAPEWQSIVWSQSGGQALVPWGHTMDARYPPVTRDKSEW